MGINANIFEPVSSSSNILGYPNFTFLDIDGAPSENQAEANYVNQLFVDGAGTQGEETLNVKRIKSLGGALQYAGDVSILNALIHHRGGSYGYPSWKQMRGGEHPITRVLRKKNISTFMTRDGLINARPHNSYLPGSQANFLGEAENSQISIHDTDRVINNFYEMPVTARFKPVTFAYFSPGAGGVTQILGNDAETDEFERNWLFPNVRDQEVLLAGQISYGNKISSFANKDITNLLRIDETTNQSEILDLFLSHTTIAGGSMPAPDSFTILKMFFQEKMRLLDCDLAQEQDIVILFGRANRGDRQSIYKLSLILDIDFNAGTGSVSNSTDFKTFVIGGTSFKSVKSDFSAVSGALGLHVRSRVKPTSDSNDRILALDGAASSRDHMLAVAGAGLPESKGNRNRFRDVEINTTFQTPCKFSYAFRGAASNDDGYVYDAGGGSWPNPEAEKDLFVQYKVDGTDTWITLEQHINTRNTDGSYPLSNIWHQAEHTLSEAIGNVRFRFVSRTDKGTAASSFFKQDIWLIDNVKIESTAISSIPLIEQNSMNIARLARTVRNQITMITSSVWPLDARKDFTQLPTNLTHSFRQFSGSATGSISRRTRRIRRR